MNVGSLDPNRNRAIVYSNLGDPDSPRNVREAVAAENLAALDEAVRKKLRRQRIIGSVIVLLAFALLAAFLIFRLLTQ